MITKKAGDILDLPNRKNNVMVKKQYFSQPLYVATVFALKLEWPINNAMQLESRKVLRIAGNRISSEKVIVRYKHKRFKSYKKFLVLCEVNKCHGMVTFNRMHCHRLIKMLWCRNCGKGFWNRLRSSSFLILFTKLFNNTARLSCKI